MLILFDKINNLYYTDNLEKSFYCENCKEDLSENVAIFITYYYRKGTGTGPRFFTYCINCRKSIKRDLFAFYSEMFMIRVTNNPPPNLEIRSLFIIPQLSNSSGLSINDVELLDSPRIIDNTRYAGRESWDGSSIGANVDDLLLDKDKPLSNKEGLLLLDELFKAKPLLSYEDKILLENKEEIEK